MKERDYEILSKDIEDLRNKLSNKKTTECTIAIILIIGFFIGYVFNNLEFNYGRGIIKMGAKKLSEYANFYELETVGVGFLKYGEALDKLNERLIIAEGVLAHRISSEGDK